MEDPSGQIKRTNDQGKDNNSEKKLKSVDSDKENLMTDLNNRIVKSIKSNNMEEVHKLWDEICTKAPHIKPNWISFLLHACSVSNEIDLAKNIVDKAIEKGVPVMEASYSALIYLLCGEDRLQEALSYLNIMEDQSVSPRIRTFTPFLEYSKRKVDIPLMLNTLETIKKFDLYDDIEIFFYILDTYTNKGDINQFIETLRTMSQMFDLGCPSIDESIQRFCQKYPEYTCSTVTINEEGECSHCHSHLTKRVLTQEDRRPLYECLETIIRERDREDVVFKDLDTFTKQNRLKIVLDGANIAHYKQNFVGGIFNFEQIYLTIDLLMKDYHYKEEDICVFLHEKHFSNDNQRLNELVSKGMVYKVHRGENDDWFWMYYALYNDIYLLSNDQMRDHFFRMQFAREFKHFTEGNQINYDIVFYNDAKHIKLTFPKCYSVCYQIKDNDHMHIPIGKKVDRDGKEYVLEKWLCFSRTE